MAKDSRLEKLRDMDPVIGTFTARQLVSSPDFVNQTYLEHAETHMSLGDTSNYVARLLRWVQINKGAIIGGIAGEYGYGKTSTAIHLWQKCEQARVVAVPPFEWHRLQDIVDATWAWVRYRVEQIQPGALAGIDRCYEKYRERSIHEFADEEGISVSKVQELLERKKVNLNCRPEDVVEFLAEISQLLESDDLQLHGPVVFTDELQVTMSRYLADHRSRDEFMQDLFELLNPLINQQGSFGLMIGLPLSTEAIISDIRPDILQRLQHCNLLIRPNTMYERDFPRELWYKFAEVFEFEDIADDVLPTDALDSIGQIAFRDDLGAGPRTVIEAMCRAIDHYDQVEECFSPIDLIDAYLEHQIAFDSGGKLIAAVSEVLQSRDVQQTLDGDKVVKLMSAFPMGCPEEQFQVYGLQDAKDELSKRVYTEYLYKFPEGVSLRKLAPTERGAEPRFIELTKDFIQTYSESERDLHAASRAFYEVVIQERLLTTRRVDQIEGWIPDSRVAGQYIGTFERKYPERRLAVRVSRDRDELTQEVEEFGLAFWFDPGCDYDSSGGVEYANQTETLALFHLNLLRRPAKPLNVPYIEELGYPLRKITPAFMLALVRHLRAKGHLIPEDEKRIQIPPFERSLIDYSVQLLLGKDLIEGSEFTKVGLALPQEVFSKMCRVCYPEYETLITTGRWGRVYTTYLNTLGAEKVVSSVGILRGNKPLELPEKEAMALFGESRKQTFRGLAENLSSILEVKYGTRQSPRWAIRFRQHPAEEAFMEALRSSEEKLSRGQMELWVLGQHRGLGLLHDLGYREEEIGIILQMLQARRLVDFDAKQQYFVEVLESPDERREAILAALSDLTQRADVLAQIPEFGQERFAAATDKLSKQVSACDDIEILEEHQAQLARLRDELVQFSNKWIDKIKLDRETIRNATGQVISASLPADLTRPLKGDVNWVGELTHCQMLLKEMYQRSHAAFRDVDNRATAVWNTWTDAHPNDAVALLTLYEAIRTVQSELKDAQASLGAAKGYLSSYLAWSSVLNAASRAYLDALGCETSYKEGQFHQELATVFDEITDQFQKKRLEALPNHEMYAGQIKDVQDKIDAWLRDRRENFIQDKQFYQETLQNIGVDRSNLRASPDAFDPETSRGNLYAEVLEKTLQHVQSLERELERYRTEVLYAERVVHVDVSGLATQIGQARDELAQIKRQVNDECVRQQELFAALGGAISELNTAIQKVTQGIRGILQKRPPTPKEQAVLEILQDPRGTDLSVVITSRLAQESGEFSLDELMQTVTSLFRKNQIIIRLEKRR
jgi:hypothetical protein